MARETGLDRKTVRRYVDVLHELGVARDAALDGGLVHEVGKRMQARATHEPSVERVQLIEHCDRIAQCLTANKPLRLTKVRVLLQRDRRGRQLRDVAALRDG